MLPIRAVVAATILALAMPVQGQAPAAPVVVELFTAEGCSSCPPADEVLSRLIREQPVAGAQVIALGLHVDYWDELGWKDPASLHLATKRQDMYSRALQSELYTPQIVVNGRVQLLGSDAAAAQRAIADAVQHPRAELTLAMDGQGPSRTMRAHIANLPPEAAKEKLEAFVAVTEDGLTSEVTRGENHGRTLHHDAVVRTLVSAGTVTAGRDIQKPIELRPEWNAGRLKAIVFLQGKRTHRIWGAASVPVG
jgi:hypothetical protein